MVTAMSPEDRIHLHVRLNPGASANKITGWDKNADQHPVLKVMVTTIPEKGKANEALIALLAKEWKIPKSQIIIKKGETDRNKILSVPQHISQLIRLST